MNMLENRKTYIMGALMVVLGLIGLVMPEALEALKLPDSPSGLITAGITTITLRMGIAKK